MKKIVVAESLADNGKKLLRANGFEIVETDGTVADALVKAPDAYGLLLGTKKITNEQILQFENLKIIARNGVGFNNIDVDFCAQHGIWVTITPTANASTVAETTLAEMFDLSKNIYNDSTAMRNGDFSDYKHSHRGFDLEGKTLGILGFGRIGQMVAKKASQLDMKIIYNDRFAKENDVATAVSREELFKTADIITLHMAVTPETANSIGKAEFDMMKNSASLINLARGELVKTDDLIEALKNHDIYGAALDVFDQEPLPMDSELFQLENVLLTPHIASNTVECMSRMAVDAAGEIVKVVKDNVAPQWPVVKDVK
ncbi:phosphoglycerate dehydrogenase [Lentilactobacillus senioris]|uniref:phosphoglycerate dehydrogenase n=1 Tax=Lentilactobacillus senioris TaxID=931534 RepID=UPI002282127C|nr:phosphoglycerate dehydrogenase [Lentilactobacillus senioris]MCY9806443.1 phosphoglycerate dehydrogenase [Lentilactobacillus senioris]